MRLWAPQYSEGLKLTIYSQTIRGDLQSINTLNHYIGMQELDAANFVELQVIPIILWVGVAIALLSFFVSPWSRRRPRPSARPRECVWPGTAHRCSPAS